MNTENFIVKARRTHGDKYDYSKSVYVKSKEKIIITCREHGDFNQTPNNHLRGAGCFKCGKRSMGEKQNLNTEIFITRARKTHGDVYDYSKVNYVDSYTKITIGCEKHGDFEQLPTSHLRYLGCPTCSLRDKHLNLRMSNEDFIKKAKEVHGDIYDYSVTNFSGNGSSVKINCEKHGTFEQRSSDHIYKKAGCPSCSVRFSKAEIEIKHFVENLGFKCVTSDREFIKPLELDLFIPSMNLAIEFNGIKWHSDEYGKDKWYHHNKTKMCNDKGVALIHIWEDEWDDNKQLQLDFIKSRLMVSDKERIYARNCELVSNVDKSTIKNFLVENHTQGGCNYSESVCITHKDEMVAVACFTIRNNSYELIRYCTSKIVVGGMGKCIKKFSKEKRCDIYSFVDLSRHEGLSYEKAGFKLDKILPPDYCYTYRNRRHHKFLFRKSRIKTKLPDFYDDNLTEKEMMKNAGYHRLWDCGKKRYVFKG